MSEEALVIERLDAGQTATFEYAARPRSFEKLPSKIVPIYVCNMDKAEDQAVYTIRVWNEGDAVDSNV